MRLWTMLIATLAWDVPVAAAPQQKPEFTAVALALALQEKGTVALHEVEFDDGKATIKVESARTLASIGELLQSDPMLKVEIQVHTDNAGTPAVNLRLSRNRATAREDVPRRPPWHYSPSASRPAASAIPARWRAMPPRKAAHETAASSSSRSDGEVRLESDGRSTHPG